MTAVAPFPASLDKGLLERVRRPLAAIAAMLLVIDLIGLGMHLADAVDSPFANDDPSPTRARVGGPEAVVPPASVAGTQAARRTSQAAQPLGCLALDSGCYPGATVAPAAPTSPGGTATPTPTAPGTKPTPIAQADLGVPALGTQVSLGLGDGGCTSVKLTVLALGDCPVASGDGAVVLNLGGALLGD